MNYAVAYVASKSPFPAMMGIPVVQKRVGGTAANYANRAELVAYLDGISGQSNADGYVSITCECLREYTYASGAEIPSSDLVCECGRAIIKYGG